MSFIKCETDLRETPLDSCKKCLIRASIILGLGREVEFLPKYFKFLRITREQARWSKQYDNTNPESRGVTLARLATFFEKVTDSHV